MARGNIVDMMGWKGTGHSHSYKFEDLEKEPLQLIGKHRKFTKLFTLTEKGLAEVGPRFRALMPSEESHLEKRASPELAPLSQMILKLYQQDPPADVQNPVRLGAEEEKILQEELDRGVFCQRVRDTDEIFLTVMGLDWAKELQAETETRKGRPPEYTIWDLIEYSELIDKKPLYRSRIVLGLYEHHALTTKFLGKLMPLREKQPYFSDKITNLLDRQLIEITSDKLYRLTAKGAEEVNPVFGQYYPTTEQLQAPVRPTVVELAPLSQLILKLYQQDPPADVQNPVRLGTEEILILQEELDQKNFCQQAQGTNRIFLTAMGLDWAKELQAETETRKGRAR
jgi:DNA-binding PadR family transcriptional regulator